jgi:hypothetical protein
VKKRQKKPKKKHVVSVKQPRRPKKIALLKRKPLRKPQKKHGKRKSVYNA